MRIVTLGIVSLFSLVSVLQAQVAAPSINPTRVIGGSDFNPAVLNWGGPSRVGGGTIDVDVDATPAGSTTVPFASGDGAGVQLRLVGESLAFHVERVRISLDLEPVIGGGTSEFDDSFIGAAVQWGETFSIGVGVAAEEDNEQGVVEERSLPLLGATLRLGDNLLVGAATGTETLGNGTGIGDVERSATMIGAALHSRDRMGGYHLEAYLDNRDSGQDVASGNTVAKEETFGLTAEVIFAENFLLGVEWTNTDITDPAGVNNLELKETFYSVGWVSGQGLSYVVSSGTNEQTESTGTVIELSFLVLAVAYAF